MGSVSSIENVDCPNCGSQGAHSEFYYRSGEEYIFCPTCGYRYEVTMKRDAEGTVIIENGEPVWQEEENKEPYGCLTYGVKDSIGTALITLESKKHLDDILQQISKDTESEITTLHLSRVEGGEILEEDLLYHNFIKIAKK